jgi:hypothetical protein
MAPDLAVHSPEETRSLRPPGSPDLTPHWAGGHLKQAITAAVITLPTEMG